MHTWFTLPSLPWPRYQSPTEAINPFDRVLVRHAPRTGAVCLQTSILAKHDMLRHFWELRLIVHAKLFDMTDRFFDGLVWTPWKWEQTPLDPGSSVRESWQDLWHFSIYFGEVTNTIVSKMKGDINAIGYNKNNWCIFLTLIRIWIQQKGGYGTLARVWFE